jgi:hypothetical protein
VICRCHPAHQCGKCDDRIALATELAERNERCGQIDALRICLKPKTHSGDHEFEAIDRVIPIE